jgi:MATE family, multidrug efflux pump
MTEIPSSHDLAPVTRSRVFHIAWPIVLSSATVPLLGLVDTAVIGNLGDASLIGAIAIGAMIFSFLYWGFGFLRMGTTGLIAQALGARDEEEIRATLLRALLFAGCVGVALVALQAPTRMGALALIGGSESVEANASAYFAIRIWGAPATLATYALLGFFIGLQDSRTAFILQLVLNGLNIALDILFVMGFHWGVEGVALGTLLAEVIAVGIGLVLAFRRIRARLPEKPLFPVDWPRIFDKKAIARTVSVNTDIMIRTICLIFAFAWFTNQGAKSGDVLLAANAILMQLVTFAAFFLDGFAFAAESLVGEAAGGRSRRRFKEAVKHSTELGVFTAAAISMFYLAFGTFAIDALTNAEDVRIAARTFLPWAILSPLLAIWCYQLDGIFIGATRTADMRNAMALSLAVYLVAFYAFDQVWGNHGLWAALMVFFVARTLTLYSRYPALVRSLGSKPIVFQEPLPGDDPQPPLNH